MKKLVTVFVSIFFLIGISLAGAADYGVYVKAVEKIEGDFDDAVRNCEESFVKNGWQVLASYSASVPEACTFRAHTIVVHSPEYAEKVLGSGKTASFAVPVRVSIYEDEGGIHAAFANPASINRTVMGDAAADAFSAGVMRDISRIIADAVQGRKSDLQIGEIRSTGRVGGMGGGDYKDKIEIIHESAEGTSVQDVAGRVREGIQSNKLGWRLIYSLEMPEQNISILGVNSANMEARAFKIAGERRASKEYKCPGIDHAAAFPIEVAVMGDGKKVSVAVLDGMYRMKVYFEDAGNWAFMKNVTMPGQIEDEIVSMSTSKLKGK